MIHHPHSLTSHNYVEHCHVQAGPAITAHHAVIGPP